VMREVARVVRPTSVEQITDAFASL